VSTYFVPGPAGGTVVLPVRPHPEMNGTFLAGNA
jgi:hypothetical protein